MILSHLLRVYFRSAALVRAAGHLWLARLRAERRAAELALVVARDPNPQNGRPCGWDKRLRVTHREVPGSDFPKLVGPGSSNPEWRR